MSEQKPTTTSLVRRRPDVAELTNEQLRYIASTDFVPKGLRGNLPAILACVATGRALGIPDMAALRGIHIIDGKATFSAELMVQLARRDGHSITADYGEGRVTVNGKRGDNGDEMKVTWTMSMAERAGLAGKDNWKKYPEAMLWARAVSQLSRMLFADIFAGATYVPEEVELTELEREEAAVHDALDAAVVPDDLRPDDHLDGDAADATVTERPTGDEEQTSFAELAEQAQTRKAKANAE